MFDAMDVGILSFVIAALAVDWGLNSSQMGWIGSVNSIGMAVGALIFGVFADKVGRKKIFMWTLIIIFCCKWFICFHNNICRIFNFTFLRWNGSRWRLPVASTLVSESVKRKNAEE